MVGKGPVPTKAKIGHTRRSHKGVWHLSFVDAVKKNDQRKWLIGLVEHRGVDIGTPCPCMVFVGSLGRAVSEVHRMSR